MPHKLMSAATSTPRIDHRRAVASAALFRDASIPKTGLAQNAKDLTLVRLGLLAAALCRCFVAVPSVSAAGVVLADRSLGNLRGRTCMEMPTTAQQQSEEAQLGIHPWQENDGWVEETMPPRPSRLVWSELRRRKAAVLVRHIPAYVRGLAARARTHTVAEREISIQQAEELDAWTRATGRRIHCMRWKRRSPSSAWDNGRSAAAWLACTVDCVQLPATPTVPGPISRTLSPETRRS
ncbi:hypothetical protein QBC39DRAFT_437902 [Podospora conica]|nr:hypothetical protein QBC39DRAFT_437902 [Schizothecium conicum]